MKNEELEKYKQYQKCLSGDGQHHCVYCNEILDSLHVYNLDSNEEPLPFGDFIFIKHGIIYHNDDNSDNDDYENIHRIDRA